MNLSQFKPFKLYSFYHDSIYNQIFENVTPSQNKTLLYIYIYIYIYTLACLVCGLSMHYHKLLVTKDKGGKKHYLTLNASTESSTQS